MKSLKQVIYESREDGKYIELPKKQYKPEHLSTKYQGAEYVKKAKQAWKDYQDSVIKINTENFEILVDKLLKALKSSEGQDNFIRNAQNCSFSSYHFDKETGEHDFFDNVEQASRTCRAALTTDKIDLGKILKTRQPEKKNSWDKPSKVFYWGSDVWTESLYWGLCLIAQVYNIDIPKFDKDFDPLSTLSSDARMDRWRERTFTKISDERWAKQRKKENEAFEKDVAKLKKVREKFQKTDVYKKLIEILDIVDANLKKADSNFKSWQEIYDKEMADNKHAEELKKAIEEIKDDIQDALSDAFPNPEDITWGVKEFYAAAGEAYLATGKHPEIKLIDKKTGSWLSGMHKTCKFEVKDSNGKSFGVFTFQDRGLDGPDGRPVAGFGPYD